MATKDEARETSRTAYKRNQHASDTPHSISSTAGNVPRSRQSKRDRRTSRDKGPSRCADRCYCCHWRQKETQRAVPLYPGRHISCACCPSHCASRSLGRTLAQVQSEPTNRSCLTRAQVAQETHPDKLPQGGGCRFCVVPLPAWKNKVIRSGNGKNRFVHTIF
jgi:hypothetical protein